MRGVSESANGFTLYRSEECARPWPITMREREMFSPNCQKPLLNKLEQGRTPAKKNKKAAHAPELCHPVTLKQGRIPKTSLNNSAVFEQMTKWKFST